MTIEELIKESYKTAEEHGWWEGPLDNIIPTKLALVHSEISEALEEYRNGTPFFYHSANTNEALSSEVTQGKPEGIAVELADAFIRMADLIGYLGIKNFTEILQEKMKYNKGRPWKHGGKKI